MLAGVTSAFRKSGNGTESLWRETEWKLDADVFVFKWPTCCFFITRACAKCVILRTVELLPAAGGKQPILTPKL